MTTPERTKALLEAKALRPEKKKIRERDVEKRLRLGVQDLGGRAYKFKSPGHRSAPDRLCILPYGVGGFVECKRPGEKPTPQQLEEHEFLRSRGSEVDVVATYEEVDGLLLFWQSKLRDRYEKSE